MAGMRLPAVMDLRVAEPLKTALSALRGADLTLDASEVERLGGLCLQVLVSAARTWAADGRTFAITPTSPAMEEQLRLLGCGGLTRGLEGRVE